MAVVLRACAVVGDRTTTGGTILTGGAGQFMVISGKPAALWGDIASCPKCKSTGRIVGEAFPIQTVNGQPVARTGDLVLCQCPTRPRVLATGIANMVDDEFGGTGTGTVGEVRHLYDDREMFDRHFQLLDDASQQPLACRRYRLSWPGGSVEGVTNASGYTQRVQLLNPEEVSLEILPEGD
ncbi:hypothetical protein CYD94_20680 (plasmid) [Ralstonia solanacearum]|uniref:PAAR domain-containing protein n=3 Tax=Ralstonia solanacearum species complex TaxID=3116862 RepID=A0A454TQK4_9RALS|nr:hypothetical protein CYD94_20680 [Ralstonia solanacearum]AYA48665.1 hypothetical protein RSP824_19630 [Ralstonia pseudosolanacearum]AXV74870.1 hypothetical protein CJO75_18755 [Ralstonia solanacearum]AXW16735.1 hypothetical protein CJO84_19015 [Ralstonia solanacearum]AXW40423.1 hypothetical protein CJO89_19385 [Ralstonia solanacearum]